jgi:hypothetical protein
MDLDHMSELGRICNTMSRARCKFFTHNEQHKKRGQTKICEGVCLLILAFRSSAMATSAANGGGAHT